MKQETILVVENDQFLRELYVDYFKNENFMVDTVTIGEEAEGKLKQGGWDVVLVDLGISQLNVFKALEAYKRSSMSASSKKPPVFIVILMYEDQAQKALELADAVFIKTHFTPGDVLEKVQTCLQQRRERQSASPTA